MERLQEPYTSNCTDNWKNTKYSMLVDDLDEGNYNGNRRAIKYSSAVMKCLTK
jgi:hypothetical protein